MSSCVDKGAVVAARDECPKPASLLENRQSRNVPTYNYGYGDSSVLSRLCEDS
jgi:hypothetical protein